MVLSRGLDGLVKGDITHGMGDDTITPFPVSGGFDVPFDTLRFGGGTCGECTHREGGHLAVILDVLQDDEDLHRIQGSGFRVGDSVKGS